jgi:hypothetical protein
LFGNLFNQIRYGVGSCLDHLTIIDHKLSSRKNLLKETSYQSKNLIAIMATFYEDRTDYMNQLQVEIENNSFQVLRVRNSKTGFDSSRELGRKNRGFDLGIFRDVVGLLSTRVDEGKIYEILFVNDSVEYQPGTISKLIQIFRAKEDSKLYSIFASEQRGYHLQSYIFYIKCSGDQILQLKSALSNFRNWKFKRTAVHRGERALPSYLAASGISTEPLFSLEYLYKTFPQVLNGDFSVAKMRLEINPTYTFLGNLGILGIYAKKF